MSDDEYLSINENDENIFNIYNKIIDKKDDKTFLIKISFRELLEYCNNWCYNREINIEKVEELYNVLIIDYPIPWTLHAVYDENIDIIKKIRIIDGQHRMKSIENYIKNYDKNMTCDRYIWIWIYEINKSEEENSNLVIDLFNKINNNRIFNTIELPNNYIIDLIKKICKNNILKKGIGIKDINNKCHSPYIHRKELNTIFNEKIDILTKYNYDDIIKNLIEINHILSLKSYDELYYDKTQFKKYEKALSIRFYLNLGKKSKYPIEKWINYLFNIKDLI